MYQKYKDNPPIQRGCTNIAGKILWARNLKRKLTIPMRKFNVNIMPLK